MVPVVSQVEEEEPLTVIVQKEAVRELTGSFDPDRLFVEDKEKVNGMSALDGGTEWIWIADP